MPVDNIPSHSEIIDGDNIQVHSHKIFPMLLPVCNASFSSPIHDPQSPPRHTDISNEYIISSQSIFHGTIDSFEILTSIRTKTNVLFHTPVRSIERSTAPSSEDTRP